LVAGAVPIATDRGDAGVAVAVRAAPTVEPGALYRSRRGRMDVATGRATRAVGVVGG
jgi:hypothetical protein